MLLDSKEILKIESRFSSLIERTFFKGTLGQRAPAFKDSVSKWFKSKTFEKQMNSIIDDTCLFSAEVTDNQIKKSLNASLPGSPPRRKLSAADDIPLLITDEAVRQADGLAAEVVDSIVIMLKDEGLYKNAPATLERLVRDLWGGDKYRATRFVRTFIADIATTTAVHRYKQNEVDMQFYAKIDGRTSPQCKVLHGTIWKYDSPDISGHVPPLHFHCRSSLVPYPRSLVMDTDLLFENRNFAKQMNQNFSFSENEVDSKVIKKVFKDIGTFNEKYRISQFILDEDIEKRLMKLGVGVNVDVPKVKVPKVKTQTVKKEPTIQVKQTEERSKSPLISKHEETIRSYETGIVKRKTEKAYIFDSKGNVLLEKEGGKSNVRFTPDEAKHLRGSIMTHNHPGNGPSFSEADIHIACSQNLQEMRAVGKQGIFSARMKDGTQFKASLYTDKIQKQYQISVKKIKDEGMIKINKHEITPDKYTKNYWHWVWEDVFNKIPEVEYKLVKLK